VGEGSSRGGKGGVIKEKKKKQEKHRLGNDVNIKKGERKVSVKKRGIKTENRKGGWASEQGGPVGAFSFRGRAGERNRSWT